jgi:hypothetical protein
VPGAVTAQPVTRYVQRGKTVQAQVLEDEQGAAGVRDNKWQPTTQPPEPE